MAGNRSRGGCCGCDGVRRHRPHPRRTRAAAAAAGSRTQLMSRPKFIEFAAVVDVVAKVAIPGISSLRLGPWLRVRPHLGIGHICVDGHMSVRTLPTMRAHPEGPAQRAGTPKAAAAPRQSWLQTKKLHHWQRVPKPLQHSSLRIFVVVPRIFLNFLVSPLQRLPSMSH